MGGGGDDMMAMIRARATKGISGPPTAAAGPPSVPPVPSADTTKPPAPRSPAPAAPPAPSWHGTVGSGGSSPSSSGSGSDDGWSDTGESPAAAIRAQAAMHREAKEAAHAEIAQHEADHDAMHEEHAAVLSHIAMHEERTSVLSDIRTIRKNVAISPGSTRTAPFGAAGLVSMPASAPGGFHCFTPPGTETFSCKSLAILTCNIPAATVENR